MMYVFIAATVIVHALLCLLAADFLAGLLHWAEDTWAAAGFWRGPEWVGERLGAHVYRATPARGGY